MNEAVKIGPMTEEEAWDAAVVLHFWDEWVASMTGQHEPSHTEKVFLAEYGCKPKSPGALMFAAFEAGMNYGIELVDTEKNG